VTSVFNPPPEENQMTTQGLHRLAGALDRMRREAATGTCALCPRPSIGFVESWDLHPKGVCEQHAEQGRRLGYTVHTITEAAPVDAVSAPPEENQK